MLPFKFYLLTKEDCPNCRNLKTFLDVALKSHYNPKIFIVRKEEDEEHYNELVEKYQLMSVPALIDIETGEMVTGFNPPKTMELLQKYD